MKPSTHLFRTIVKNPLQKMSTASHETTGSGTAMAALKSILQVPTWSLVGLGTAAAGFFGKMLHDDNLATRAELQTTAEGLRKELHDTTKELREDNKALRAEMNSHVKELRAEMNANNKELREDNKALRAEMNAGFEKINVAIANLSHGPK